MTKSWGHTYIGIQFFRLSSRTIWILFFFFFLVLRCLQFYLFSCATYDVDTNYLAQSTRFHTSIAYFIKNFKQQLIGPSCSVCCVVSSEYINIDLKFTRCHLLGFNHSEQGLGKNLTRSLVFYGVVSGCSQFSYYLADFWLCFPSIFY